VKLSNPDEGSGSAKSHLSSRKASLKEAKFLSFSINARIPMMLIIRLILKELARSEDSAFTPSKPLKRKASTFKFRLICPNGSGYSRTP